MLQREGRELIDAAMCKLQHTLLAAGAYARFDTSLCLGILNIIADYSATVLGTVQISRKALRDSYRDLFLQQPLVTSAHQSSWT